MSVVMSACEWLSDGQFQWSSWFGCADLECARLQDVCSKAFRPSGNSYHGAQVHLDVGCIINFLEWHMTSCQLLHCLAYTLRVIWTDGGGGGNGVLAPAIPKLLPMTLMLPLPRWTLSSLLC